MKSDDSMREGKSMGDNRKLERFNLKIPSRIMASGGTIDKTTFDLTTLNVSSGGAFYSTATPLPEGTRVNVRMALPLKRLRIIKDQPKSVQVTIGGKVLRTSKVGMAVRFNNQYKFHRSPTSGSQQVLESLAKAGEMPPNIPGGTL